MDYKNITLNGVEISTQTFNNYLDGTVGKLFAILGVYEDSVQTNSFEIFDTYTFRVMCELRGFYDLTQSPSFISLSSIIQDVRRQVLDAECSDKVVEHKRVKSLVFHCISIAKKERVDL